MDDDLLQRLRMLGNFGHDDHGTAHDAADEIERLRAQLAERDRDAEQLHEALREAMYQATEYDGLDLATIGPQHWYTKAAAIDAAMATPKD